MLHDFFLELNNISGHRWQRQANQQTRQLAAGQSGAISCREFLKANSNPLGRSYPQLEQKYGLDKGLAEAV
jgi:hypothetical protein